MSVTWHGVQVDGLVLPYVAVKILPHPHTADCTRGIPPNVARSGDVLFGYPPGMSPRGGGEVPGKYPCFGVSPGYYPT